MNLEITNLGDLMIRMGFNPGAHGFEYIQEAVRILRKTNHNIKTCDLYKEVGKQHDTTGPCAERCIRSAIRVAYTQVPEGDPAFDLLKSIAGTVYLAEKSVPTNTVFLYGLTHFCTTRGISLENTSQLTQSSQSTLEMNAQLDALRNRYLELMIARTFPNYNSEKEAIMRAYSERSEHSA